jgi:hypothetical protein
MIRKRSIVAILLCVVMVVVLGAFLLRQAGRSEEKARRAACLSNVKWIGKAITAYRDGRAGQYPQSLHELYPQYLESAKTLVCPGDRRKEMAQGTYTSYIYLRPNGETEPQQVIIEERTGNHSGWGKDLAGCTVLRGDGQVVWVPDAE